VQTGTLQEVSKTLSFFSVYTLFRQTAGAALVAALLVSGPAQATVAEFVRSQTAVQGRAIIDAARAMPADRYGFAPDTDPMTFGELVLHVAVGNYLFCSHIGGTAEPSLSEVAPNGPKEALVSACRTPSTSAPGHWHR